MGGKGKPKKPITKRVQIAPSTLENEKKRSQSVRQSVVESS
jgi:hypothetical protein